MNPTPHPHLLEWWKDDPADPARPFLNDPAVQRLAEAIAPGAVCTDLGGVMSLNAHLDPAGLVLRVHQPFVSRRRLLDVQRVRCRLAAGGLCVPVPLVWQDRSVFRCRNRWAELEAYLPHERPAPTMESYVWLFGAMGTLHRLLAEIDLTVSRPCVATYAPPGSLLRWLRVTEGAVHGHQEIADATPLLRDLVQRLHTQWLPASTLPRQLVHGDVRLSNVGRTTDGTPLYLDFGFLAVRPRIHELAYALAFMVRALDGHHDPARFAWHCVEQLVETYEEAACTRLTAMERQALAPYTASVPLYYTALAGLTNNPAGELRAKLPFLRLSAWLLEHPAALAA